MTTCGGAKQNVSTAPFASEDSGGAESAVGEQSVSVAPAGVCQVSATGWFGTNPVPVTCVYMPSTTTVGFAVSVGCVHRITVSGAVAISGPLPPIFSFTVMVCVPQARPCAVMTVVIVSPLNVGDELTGVPSISTVNELKSWKNTLPVTVIAAGCCAAVIVPGFAVMQETVKPPKNSWSGVGPPAKYLSSK